MCGIVGIIGNKEASSTLIEGLKRLEYRGYDSAGIATIANGNINRVRAKGKLSNLEQKLDQSPIAGTIGIGHTRWATHGNATENNAHPHATDKVAVVHNGIIENYIELKEELINKGYNFTSDTDTEVIAHLITDLINQGMDSNSAVTVAEKRLEGSYSIAAIFEKEDLIIGVRRGTPLVIGYGDNEMYLASDSYALAPLTKEISFLEDGDHILLKRNGAVIKDANDNDVTREVHITEQSSELAEKDLYDHFMLKEIHEQPAVISKTIMEYIDHEKNLANFPKEILEIAHAPRITISSCGTAYYAGLVAKYWLEKYARIPVEVDIASEFRYRDAPLPKDGVALFISQSGETLDTLEALRLAKSKGQKIVSMLNTIESTMERESDIVLRTLAGSEIGVASTKAFTTQLSALACLTIALGRENGSLTKESERELITALKQLPSMIEKILEQKDKIKEVAEQIAEHKNALFIGRGSSFPIALEGSLKLKEISYIHAEGYTSGEMKHGPIALIDETMPTIVIAPSDKLFTKTSSNTQEIAARGGNILLISDKNGISNMSETCKWSIQLPVAQSEMLNPIIYTIPVQLLAYYAALYLGNDVDKPRNLAKSVTVE